MDDKLGGWGHLELAQDEQASHLMTSTNVVAALSILLAACTYDASFSDCTVACSDTNECPSGLSCGAEGRCREPGMTDVCPTPIASVNASCVDLAPTCGPTGTDDCCSTATTIPSGTFFRSYDVAGDGMYPDKSYPATVSSFKLDKYEVTVGRFRKFIEAGQGTLANPPTPGAGARMLNGMAAQGGWDASWDAELSTDTATLETNVKCDLTYQTWTDAPGANESLPINCVTWYEAMAFCVWDRGFLPSEDEWLFAAAGGDQQRAYPWSLPAGSTMIDQSYANYATSSGGVNRVGSESPKGDGRWEQADLAGNVWEWLLDYLGPYNNPCDNCALLLTPTSNHVVHGGSFGDQTATLRDAGRIPGGPSTHRGSYDGARCAFAAP